MKRLREMTVDEFIKMFNDIDKGHHLENKKIEAAQMHLPDGLKTYGFGYKKANGQFSSIWEFQTLVRTVKICDWLDFNGFKRPKWSPDGIINKDYI